MIPELPPGYKFIYTVSERRERLCGDSRPPCVIVSVGGHPHGIVGSAWQEVGPNLDIRELERRAVEDAKDKILARLEEVEKEASAWWVRGRGQTWVESKGRKM